MRQRAPEKAWKSKGAAEYPRRLSLLEMVSAENQAIGFRSCRCVPRLHVRPVDDIPERLDVVRLDVLVLQVEGVLPHVDLQQRDDAQRDVGLLVVQLEGQQPVAEAVVTQDRPARSLQSVGGRAELSLELVERSELLVDRGGEVTGRLVAAVKAVDQALARLELRVASFCQKMLWLTWPPKWKARFFSFKKIEPWSPLARASSSFATASLRPLT